MSKLIILFIAILSTGLSGCAFGQAKLPNETKTGYIWNEITGSAAYPQGYGFPVFVANEKMYAFHHEAVWTSADGANWTKTNLPSVKRDAYETRYVQFNNAVYALGQNRGNYADGIQFGSTVRRTTDFKSWETLAEKSELPDRVFHGTIVFGGKIWLMGGYDGKNYYNDIWNSTDGVRWTRVSEHAAWSARNVGVVEFKNRLWIFGGGVIDGDKEINPDSHKEVWSSADGVNWTQEKMKTERRAGGTPVVYADKLWFVGANRNDGSFDNAVLVSADGVTWQAQSAPWSPRGAVAVWIFNNKLFMTGGKYSYMKNGEPVFVYSRDVWAMSRKTE
ncbi:MAG TPA: hypothetical protein VGB00_20075 [Pyrinomonadaceae bacterium]